MVLILIRKCDNAMQEAKQAIELIGKWEMIDVADALELLSPDFESDEVCNLPTFICTYFWLHFVNLFVVFP
jgi:hypothetical protein